MDRPVPFQQVASTFASNTNVDFARFQHQPVNITTSSIDVDSGSLQQTANINVSSTNADYSASFTSVTTTLIILMKEDESKCIYCDTLFFQVPQLQNG